MTYDELFIRVKMKALNGYRKEIENFLKMSDDEILNDEIGKIHIGERVFQLAVDAVIDINQHIMRELDLKGAEDPQGAFYILGDEKIIPGEFAFNMAPVVSVRNRLVHGYDTFDKSLFLRNLRKGYPHFEEYLKLINEFLDKGNLK